MTAYFEEIPLMPPAGPFVEAPPRGFRAGLLLVVASLTISPLAALPPYWATVSIGFLGTLAVALCLLYKYHGRIPLNIETCFSGGTAIQCLFAPALIRMVSDNFTASYWRESADHAYVKGFYGPAMMVVMVFLAAALLATGFFRGPYRQRIVGGRIGSVFSRRTPLLVVLMIINVWTARATLLAVGAFYHVHHTKFVESDAYSALAQVDLGLGMIVVAFVWTGVFVSNGALLVAIPYTLLDVGWNFVAGNRQPIGIDMIIIALTFYIGRNRIPWKFIAIVSVPLLMLFGFMSSFRYSANKMDAHTIDLGAVVEAIRNQTNSDNNGPSSFVTALARLNNLDSIGAIYAWTPEQQPYLMGETWARIPEAMIPRQFVKDKKPVIVPIGEWFFRHDGGSSPTTAPGEGYLNLGWAGVILTGLVCGFLVRATEWSFSLVLWNGAVLPIYVAALGIFARHHGETLSIWIAMFVKLGVFMSMVHFLTRPSKVGYHFKLLEAETAIPPVPFNPAPTVSYSS